MKEVTTDTAEIDRLIVDAEGEQLVAMELAKMMVDENASTARDQEDYMKKYKVLEERLNAITKKMNELESKKKRNYSHWKIRNTQK